MLADFFLAYAVTPIHVGVGRSPGVVDLPIARDGFGFPFIPGSSIKGTVKSSCLRLSEECPSWRSRCTGLYGWDIRLGGEVPEEAYASPVVFTDAYLLLYPVRVEDEEGLHYAYATSPLQLQRLRDLLAVCGTPCSRIEVPSACSGDREVGGDGVIYMNNIAVPRSIVGEVSLCLPIGNLGALPARLVEGGVYLVMDDAVFRDVVEAGLVRQTRVRLDYKRKVVEPGGLWTEEYVSQGAVFYFAAFYRTIRGVMDEHNAMRYNRCLLRELGYVLSVGGKETIGKGILKLLSLTE